jgi:hypothetical protein
MPDHIPIACTLSSAELRAREITLLSQFKSLVIATEEIEQGYSFRLPGDKMCLAVVAEVMLAERECCTFLKFELAAEPGQGPLTLRVIGPVGTKEFIKSLLV